MASDKQIRTTIFGVAIVGLVAASAAGATVFDDGFSGPRINYEHNYDIDHDNWDEDDFVSEDRDLANFNKIKVLGALQVRTTAGDTQKVTVSAKPEDMERVKTWVEGDTLYIDTVRKDKKFNNGVAAKVEMVVAGLTMIDVEGAIDGRFEGINADTFTIDVEGASNIRVEGTCETIDIDMAGASNIEADGLECKNANIGLEGVGNIEAFATEKVNARLEGIGSIEVRGGAKDITKRKDGFGDIDIR